ncbi:hypothetical protein [Dokdonia sp.]
MEENLKLLIEMYKLRSKELSNYNTPSCNAVVSELNTVVNDLNKLL